VHRQTSILERENI